MSLNISKMLKICLVMSIIGHHQNVYLDLFNKYFKTQCHYARLVCRNLFAHTATAHRPLFSYCNDISAYHKNSEYRQKQLWTSPIYVHVMPIGLVVSIFN